MIGTNKGINRLAQLVDFLSNLVHFSIWIDIQIKIDFLGLCGSSKDQRRDKGLNLDTVPAESSQNQNGCAPIHEKLHLERPSIEALPHVNLLNEYKQQYDRGIPLLDLPALLHEWLS